MADTREESIAASAPASATAELPEGDGATEDVPASHEERTSFLMDGEPSAVISEASVALPVEGHLEEEAPEGETPAVSASQDAAYSPLAVASSDEMPATIEALSAARHVLEGKLDILAAAFETKLAIDEHKNQQIDTLHRELQSHKQDLLAKALRPLVAGLVRLHDNLGRMADTLRDRTETLPPDEAARLVKEFQEDVEILLDENGVALFTEPVDRFEPRRQTVRQTQETTDSEQVGHIVRRVRPGFERDGFLLQKERVDVYVAATVPAPVTTQNDPGA